MGCFLLNDPCRPPPVLLWSRFELDRTIESQDNSTTHGRDRHKLLPPRSAPHLGAAAAGPVQARGLAHTAQYTVVKYSIARLANRQDFIVCNPPISRLSLATRWTARPTAPPRLHARTGAPCQSSLSRRPHFFSARPLALSTRSAAAASATAAHALQAVLRGRNAPATARQVSSARRRPGLRRGGQQREGE
jgi:hypothetical protein